MTSVFGYIPQSGAPLPPHLNLPTMYDLPSENPLEPGLLDDFHFLQPILLYLTFQPTNWNPDLVVRVKSFGVFFLLNSFFAPFAFFAVRLSNTPELMTRTTSLQRC